MPDTANLNLVTLVERFRSEDACREYLAKLRWPDGITCPRCASDSVSEISTRDQWDCNVCRYRFSVTSGTIFDNTKLDLWKWFATVYLMIESRKGMSASQIQRTLGVTYKTAWFLCHRIREAMRTDDEGPTLFGIVEVDETVVSGRKRHKERGSRNSWAKKERIWVAGALQRGGQIRLEHIPNVRKSTLHSFIKRHTKPDTEAIYTDELRSYIGIADHDTRHETVRHTADEWVIGDVHTNGVENVWSLLKRSIMGAYHKISIKHLDAYLEELEYRFNNRTNPYMFRDVLTRILTRDALRYRELTA